MYICITLLQFIMYVYKSIKYPSNSPKVCICIPLFLMYAAFYESIQTKYLLNISLEKNFPRKKVRISLPSVIPCA